MLEAKASILAAETQAVDHPQARSNHYDRSGVKLATRSRGEATTDLTVFSGFVARLPTVDCYLSQCRGHLGGDDRPKMGC